MTKTILIAFLLVTITLGSMTPYAAYADDDDDDKNTKFKKHKVITGDGPPPAGLGKIGDLYIDSSDTDNLIVYKKTSKNTWINLGSFQGPAGSQGLPGEQGDKGDTGEQGPAGQDGLNCWDLDGDGAKDLPDEDANGDGMVDVADCKGQKGDKGNKGDTGETGPAGSENFVFVQQQGNSAELNDVSFGAGTGSDLVTSHGAAITWDRTKDVFIVNEDGFYEVGVFLTVNDFTDPSTFDQVRLQLFVGGFSMGLSQGYVGLFEQMSYHWIGQLRSGTEVSAKIVTLNPSDEMGIANQSTMSVKKLS